MDYVLFKISGGVVYIMFEINNRYISFVVMKNDKKSIIHEVNKSIVWLHAIYYVMV